MFPEIFLNFKDLRGFKRGHMAKISLNDQAPDFTLMDYRGQEVSLSEFRGDKYVLLVFNRGFM